MNGSIKSHELTKEQRGAIFGNGNTSVVHAYDVKTGQKVKLRKPEFLKHVQKHKNGKKSETIIAVGNHPHLKHRVRQIVHRKVN